MVLHQKKWQRVVCGRFEEIETEEVTNYAEIMPAFVDHNPIENTVHSNDQTKDSTLTNLSQDELLKNYRIIKNC
jgi:hypothetical protein